MWAQKWVVGCWMWARDMLDVGCESFQKWVVGCWMWAKNLLDLDVGCESFQGDVSSGLAGGWYGPSSVATLAQPAGIVSVGGTICICDAAENSLLIESGTGGL